MKIHGVCLECEYSEQLDTKLDGEFLTCRRYAPRPTEGEASASKVSWPMVRVEDWCGDFLEREPDEQRDDAALERDHDDALIAPFQAFSPRLREMAACLRLIPRDRAEAALQRAHAERPTNWEPFPGLDELLSLPPEKVNPKGPIF